MGWLKRIEVEKIQCSVDNQCPLGYGCINGKCRMKFDASAMDGSTVNVLWAFDTQGNCVDKICCDKPRAAACFSCKQTLTGKADGTCAPVGNGKKDPQNSCADETATNQCGKDGYGDGAGACRQVGTDLVCKVATCMASVFSPISTCDGKGACKVVLSTDYGTAQCDPTLGC